MLNNSTVLITGGTGSFGHKFVRVAFDSYKPKKVIVFSRDEFKQYNMAKLFPDSKYPIRYFLGDIRDRDRLGRAFYGVDIVVHAAALKQVPALEYNPTEAVKTNIIGADNIVDAAVDAGVKKVIALSTDKAVNPINLYGATKLAAEKIIVAANAYSGERTAFSVVRYGNVVASRGSVIPVFLDLKQRGVKEFPITDLNMTRFWMTLKQSVGLVIKALEVAVGGEVFVPRIPSMKITDLARAIEPDCEFRVTGIRPGEKVHETLISEDESRNTKILDDIYVIISQYAKQGMKVFERYKNNKPVQADFAYRSDKNDRQLTCKELQKILKDMA